MHNYIIKVRHDNGLFTIRVRTWNKDVAKELVMRMEGCPLCAIVSVERVR